MKINFENPLKSPIDHVLELFLYHNKNIFHLSSFDDAN